MEHKKFNEKIKNDKELLNEIPVLRDYLEKEETLDGIYFLCRETFLTQYNSKAVRLENGFGYEVPQESFRRLKGHIDNFIGKLNVENELEVTKEVLEVLKHYYMETASSEEKTSRTHFEKPASGVKTVGLQGTLYNFNQIDWNYFKEGLGLNF